MMGVRGRSIFLLRVTLQTDAVAFRAQLRGMRLVTVAAGDPGREHLALFEGAVVVGLLHVAHLSVGRIDAALQAGDRVSIGERATRQPILGELAAARMTTAAGLDLLAQQGRRVVSLRL